MKNKDRSYIESIAVIITALLIIVSIFLIIFNYFKKEKIRRCYLLWQNVKFVKRQLFMEIN